MNKRITISLTLVLAINLVFWLVIFPYGQVILEQAYNGNSPTWIQKIYPRLSTEILRHDQGFFEHRIQLIGIRLGIISGLIILFLLGTFKRVIRFYSKPEGNTFIIEIASIIYYAAIGLIMLEWLGDLKGITLMQPFYSPIWFLKPFGSHFIQTLPIFYGAYLLSIPLHFFRKTKIAAAILSFFSFLITYGFIQSFGKVDHGMIPVVFCMFFFMIFRLKKDYRYIRFIWLSIGLMYFFSGLEKLTAGGISFISGEILKFHFMRSGSELLNLMAFQPWVSFVSVCILLFQLGWIFLIPLKKHRLVIIATGFVFHISITFLMDINILLNPWLLSYLWFLPLFFTEEQSSHESIEKA